MSGSNEARWFSATSPWPWLVYLLLFFLPWLAQPPTNAQLWGAAWVLPLFFFLYFRGFFARGVLGWLYVVALALLGFAALPVSPLSTVFVVYAAAFSGYQRPRRDAVIGVVLTALSILLVGTAIGMHPANSAVATFFTGVVGWGCILSSELITTNEALRASEAEAAVLASAAERERIGRDLHDLLGHTLTVVSIKADLAARLLDHAPDRARDEIEAIQNIARGALGEIRQAVAGLRDVSLAAEISRARRALESANIELELDARAEAKDSECEHAVAMVMREAVTNVVRHSNARTCRIVTDRDDEAFVLTVEDDGRGSVPREGNGIRSMRERLAARSGTLEIRARDGVGLRLVARVPAETRA